MSAGQGNRKRERTDKALFQTFKEQEFKGYNAGKFGKDVLAGITVAAVALPLALAFGISAVRLPPQDLSRHLSQVL